MRLAIVDSDGAVVAIQGENGSIVPLGTTTRTLKADERNGDGSLVGRAGETVRVPSALEDGKCDPKHFDAHGLALVDDDGTVRALVGPLQGFDRATFDKARAAKSKRKPAATDEQAGEQQPAV